jgi:hypothetical protein
MSIVSNGKKFSFAMPTGLHTANRGLFKGLTMKLELNHVDTCLPDFWSGHHLPHVQIPVYHNMSLKDIKQALRYELSMGYVMGSTDYARLLRDDFIGAKNEKLADKVTRAAYAAINRIKPANKGQRKFFTDLEPSECEDEIGDSVYAFFVFVEA